MKFLIEQQWVIFISLELLSLIFLILFLGIRYIFNQMKLSHIFLFFFFLMLILEAILAILVYKETGVFTSFQIIVGVFIIYACTFGINDFKNIDRWMKGKIDKYKGTNLLTDHDKSIIKKKRDPKYKARIARLYFYCHTSSLLIGLTIFWFKFGVADYSFLHFIKHIEWYNDENIQPQPFTYELIMKITRIWLLIYVIDTIINWSYTFFPDKK